MHRRPIRGALALAVAGTLLVAGLASADSVRADGDAVTAGAQSTVDLGQVAPSSEITFPVAFQILCGDQSHLDPGQQVTLTHSGGIVPTGGEIVSATVGTTGVVPSGWVPDGSGCPWPAPVVDGGSPSIVTLRAPALPGSGYTYTVAWTTSVGPAGVSDPMAVRATTMASFILEVVANDAPTLVLPEDISVEGDTTGGWIADFTASATDAEDDPDPSPVCSPAAGEVLPLGTTTVACSVTDSSSATTSGSFTVTVVDTTAPAISLGVDQQVTTADPTGTTLVYASPVVTDGVDADPDVACDPVDGSWIPVGTTTVTCTATDASGNSASASLTVDVSVAPAGTTPGAAAVQWWEPIGLGTESLVANRGRTIPIKATLDVEGEARTVGAALVAVTPCDGGNPLLLPLRFRGGRWAANLDTSGLAGACHVVEASIDGLSAGSFTLDLVAAPWQGTGAKPR
ncbi:MAG: HYR domain-containing protein [Chloroflexota bacterium]|jgi:hypothetical protein|nr:HYR domain-containing protein [Chloroflexota bacterium]